MSKSPQPHRDTTRSRKTSWRTVQSGEARQLYNYGHAVCLYNNDMISVGGCNQDGKFSSSFCVYQSDIQEWKEIKTENPPQARHFHCSVTYEDVLYLFGGKSNGYHSSLHKYEFSTNKWTHIEANANSQHWPIARYGHSAIIHNASIFIFGGYGADGYCVDDVFQWKIAENIWVKIPTHKTHSKECQLDRFHHSAEVYGNVMLVFGGKNGKGDVCTNSLVEYHIHTNSWTALQTIGTIPCPRWGHCSAVNAECMFIFGGSDGTSEYGDLYQYHIASRTWTVVEVDWCPAPRYFCTAVCTHEGTVLQVYGGKNKLNKCFGDIYSINIDTPRKKRSKSKKKERTSEGKGSDNNNINSNNNNNTSNTSNNTISNSGSSGALSIEKKKRSTRKKRVVRFKCYFNDEIRIIPVSNGIKYNELLDKLRKEYADSLTIQYKDDDGDLITVRSQTDLDVMIHDPNSTMKVYLCRSLNSSGSFDNLPYSLGSPLGSLERHSGQHNSSNSGSGSNLLSHSQQIHSPKPTMPQFVSRWQVTGTELGHGAFGKVFLGMNADTGGLIAVKQVNISHHDPLEQDSNIHSLQREIEVMQELNHVNIVRYLGSQRVDTTLNIFLEYVPGGSIHHLLSKFTRFSESVTRSFTKQILQGLSYLHEHRIVHRDIKGANILVDNDATIKLADFGAAKQLADIKSYASSVTGTPYWMAPEVIQGNSKSYGRKADIWSVGAVVIEMTTGKPPFYDLPPLTALFKLGSSDILPDIPSTLSPVAQHFLYCCFQRNPDNRPSADELLKHPFITGDHSKPLPELFPLVQIVKPVGAKEPEAVHSTASNNEYDSSLWSSLDTDIPSMISFLRESTTNSVVSLSGI